MKKVIRRCGIKYYDRETKSFKGCTGQRVYSVCTLCQIRKENVAYRKRFFHNKWNHDVVLDLKA